MPPLRTSNNLSHGCPSEASLSIALHHNKSLLLCPATKTSSCRCSFLHTSPNIATSAHTSNNHTLSLDSRLARICISSIPITTQLRRHLVPHRKSLTMIGIMSLWRSLGSNHTTSSRSLRNSPPSNRPRHDTTQLTTSHHNMMTCHTGQA